MKLLLGLLVPVILTVYTGTTYRVTDDYSVKFSTKKAEGTFRGLEGTLKFSPDALTESFFDMTVDVSTIQTGNKTKDKHARGKAWLDAETHPKIQFTSNNFVQKSDGFLVNGQLTIKGKTRQVAIPFSFIDNVFKGEIRVNRDDYEIDGPFLFGSMVGDELIVSLNVPVTK